MKDEFKCKSKYEIGSSCITSNDSSQNPYLATCVDIRLQKDLIKAREGIRKKCILLTSKENRNERGQIKYPVKKDDNHHSLGTKLVDPLKCKCRAITSSGNLSCLNKNEICRFSYQNKSDQCPEMCSFNYKALPQEKWPKELLASYIIGSAILQKLCISFYHCSKIKTRNEHILMVIRKWNGCSLHKTQCGIEILKKCRHPNIVQLRNSFEDTDRFYLILDNTSHGTVMDFIRKDGPLDEVQCAKVIRGLSEGLNYLHSRGIVHGAVRPDNILIHSDDKNLVPKLANFEHASRIKDTRNQRTCDCDSEIILPPSHDSGPDGTTPTSVDVWNLGTLMYYCLSGYPPCSPTEFSSQQWNHISTDAKDLMGKMLNDDSRKRYHITDVLHHPWVKRGGQITDPSLDKHV